MTLPLDITAGVTTGHVGHHEELDALLIGLSGSVYNVEAFGLTEAGSTASNDSAMATLVATVPDGATVLVPGRYNLGATVDLHSRKSITFKGFGGSNVTNSPSAFILAADAGDRFFDCRSSRELTFDAVSFSVSDTSFDGYVVDGTDGDGTGSARTGSTFSGNTTMMVFRNLAIGGEGVGRLVTCVGLDGSYEVTFDHVNFNRFAVACDWFSGGGRGGGITTFTNRCKFDFPGLGSTMFKDPPFSGTIVDGAILEGDADGKMKILRSPSGLPSKGVKIRGCWIGDIGAGTTGVNGEHLIELIAGTRDFHLESAGGIVGVPGASTDALDMRLVKLTGDGIIGLVIDGYIQGSGCVLDYNGTTVHQGIQRRYVTDHNTTEFSGTPGDMDIGIPGDQGGASPFYGGFWIGQTRLLTGSGSPEGVITGQKGDVYRDRSGSAGSIEYLKTTGTLASPVSTGWVAQG